MGISNEINILTRPEVIITSHRVIVGSTTYAVRNITSARSKANVFNQLVIPIYLIALVQIGFCLFLSVVFQNPLVFAICFIILFLLDLSILAFPCWPFYKKGVYYEILIRTSAREEQNLLGTFEKELAVEVINAINVALVKINY